jgi:hypothetical protein
VNAGPIRIVALLVCAGVAGSVAESYAQRPGTPPGGGTQFDGVLPPTAPSDQIRRVLFELRLAEREPVRGLTIEATVRNSAQKIYPHYAVVLTNGDVQHADVIARDGRHDIELVLTADGKANLVDGTSKHRGRPLVVILDGEIAAVLPVPLPTTDRLRFDGGYSETEARAVAAGLNRW